MEAPLWNEGASAFAHEREALAFVKSRLPNHEPYRAWSNVEFIAEDGSVNEVDLLVVSLSGFFLIEIKSFPGVMMGDGQRWRVKFPDGGTTTYDHPLILTNTKAKRLRSLLRKQSAFDPNPDPMLDGLGTQIASLVAAETRALQLTADDLAAWRPPAKAMLALPLTEDLR